MRLRAIAIFLVLLMSASCASALADSGGTTVGHARHPVEVEPRFQLVGSHGYRLQVSARGATVTIGVARGNTPRAGSSTTYVARGTVGPNGIHASFHQFGRVEVRFHPTTKEAVRGLPPDCLGGSTGAATVPGYFTGNVDFHGQHDYMVAHASRVKGEVVLPPTEQCPLVAGGTNPLIEDPLAELPPAQTRMTLSAVDKEGTGGLLFVARRAGKTGYYAERAGTVGRVGLLSIDYALGPRSGFTSDPQVSYGSVHPPKPFTGSATLKRGPHGKRAWTGDLAATFPGGERVPLTGENFHTTLSRSFP